MVRPPKELKLAASDREELMRLRDHAARPSVRERCSALLKSADGMAAYAVARRGLLRPRDEDTVYRWVRYFEREGIQGLIGHQHGGKEKKPFRRARRVSGASAAGAG